MAVTTASGVLFGGHPRHSPVGPRSVRPARQPPRPTAPVRGGGARVSVCLSDALALIALAITFRPCRHTGSRTEETGTWRPRHLHRARGTCGGRLEPELARRTGVGARGHFWEHSLLLEGVAPPLRRSQWLSRPGFSSVASGEVGTGVGLKTQNSNGKPRTQGEDSYGHPVTFGRSQKWPRRDQKVDFQTDSESGRNQQWSPHSAAGLLSF